MPHVVLACCGLDHARRGYETFARECFEHLRGSSGLRIELVKGSGPAAADERSIPTLRRDRMVAQTLGRLLQFRPFRLEALAFAVSLQPLLLSRRPDVVYLSEWDTARGLAWLRSVTGQRFKLLLCNGGFAERGFEHIDHVQELTPAVFDHVVERGADASRHSVLPLGFAIQREFSPPAAADRAELRARFELPPDRRILVSVAALNRSHKRLDYLIQELAAVPQPRPFLVLCGERDDETPQLESLAASKLGQRNVRFFTLPADEVPGLLRASDSFVLTSVAEMQGRSVIEAMAQGLPCAVHDSPVMRFAVGEHGLLGDFLQPGSLTRLLMLEPVGTADPARAQDRHAHVYERFSWDSLAPRYAELLADVAQGEAANRTVSSSTGEKLSTYS